MAITINRTTDLGVARYRTLGRQNGKGKRKRKFNSKEDTDIQPGPHFTGKLRRDHIERAGNDSDGVTPTNRYKTGVLLFN